MRHAKSSPSELGLQKQLQSLQKKVKRHLRDVWHIKVDFHLFRFIFIGIAFVSLFVGLISVFSYFSQRQNTVNTEAFFSTAEVDVQYSAAVQSLINDYWGRVPTQDTPLTSLPDRGVGHDTPVTHVGYVLNFPATSDGHSDWTNPTTGEVVPGRSWTGTDTIFPHDDLVRIYSDGFFTNEERETLLRERKDAIEAFMSNFYGQVLNSTLFTKYRVEISLFNDVWRDVTEANAALQALGIQEDVLTQNADVVSACLFAEKSYRQLNVIIDTNMYDSTYTTGDTNKDNEWGRFMELRENKVEEMASAIQRIDQHVKSCATNPHFSLRFVYMNEIDLINVIAGGSGEAYSEYSIISPEGYARAYYRLAVALARRGVVLMPSTFYLGAFGSYYVEGDGLTPWIREMARHQSIKRDNLSADQQRYVLDHIAINSYEAHEQFTQKLDNVLGQVSLANGMFGSNLVFGRLQEFGLLPQQPVPHNYDGNLSQRRAAVLHAIDTLYQDRFRGIDANVFGQSGPSVSPSDVRLPDHVYVGRNSPFGIGFVYRDEDLWGELKQALHSKIQDANRNVWDGVAEPDQGGGQSDVPTSQPQEPTATPAPQQQEQATPIPAINCIDRTGQTSDYLAGVCGCTGGGCRCGGTDPSTCTGRTEDQKFDVSCCHRVWGPCQNDGRQACVTVYGGAAQGMSHQCELSEAPRYCEGEAEKRARDKPDDEYSCVDTDQGFPPGVPTNPADGYIPKCFVKDGGEFIRCESNGECGGVGGNWCYGGFCAKGG